MAGIWEKLRRWCGGGAGGAGGAGGGAGGSVRGDEVGLSGRQRNLAPGGGVSAADAVSVDKSADKSGLSGRPRNFAADGGVNADATDATDATDAAEATDSEVAEKSSVFYAITLSFVLASVSIAVAFLWLIQFDKANYTAELNAKYSYLANLKLQEISGAITKEDFDAQKRKFRLVAVPAERARAIIDAAVVLAEDANHTGLSRIMVESSENYLYVAAGGREWLYLDRSFNSYRYVSVKITLAIVLITLALSYIYVLSRLRPLRALRRQIDRFAEGDYSQIENTARGSDEISQVADAFYQAITRIKDMNSSRQFFLRNIMHELKTPITKGRITAEMLSDGKFKDRLISVFDRMVLLIDELAAVEQITSKTPKNPKRVSILHVFDEAVQMLLLETDCVDIECAKNYSVKVDYKLFSTAVKNMLDNALKYSTTGRARVRILSDRIEFINPGEKLDKPLSFYLEPFTQGGSRASNSFGLGLYVVHTILSAHKLRLANDYKNGENVFVFMNISKIKV